MVKNPVQIAETIFLTYFKIKCGNLQNQLNYANFYIKIKDSYEISSMAELTFQNLINVGSK